MYAFSFLSFAGLGRQRKANDEILRAAAWVSNGAAIPTLRQAGAVMTRELCRARRYSRPLAVVVLRLDSAAGASGLAPSTEIGGNGNSMHSAAGAPQLMNLILGPILRDTLRESDVVAFAAKDDHYVILMTESSESEARQAVERINALLQRRSLARIKTGIAEFPKMGLTLEDLILSAHAQLVS